MNIEWLKGHKQDPLKNIERETDGTMTTGTNWVIDTTVGENIRIERGVESGHDLKSTNAIEYKPQFERINNPVEKINETPLDQIAKKIAKHNSNNEIRPNYYGGQENPYEVFKSRGRMGIRPRCLFI